MAIVFPLDFPKRIPREMTIRANSTVAGSESPFSGEEQFYVWPREFWEMDMQFPPLRRDQAEELIAFMLKLNGREGSFLAGDPVSGRAPRGTLTATFAVNGAGQTGRTLAVDGLPVSTQGLLLPGDYIQLGAGATTRLHKVLNQVDSSGGGGATLDIWPRLRYSPANDAVITVLNTRGQWRLATNVSEWTIQLAQRFTLSVHCKEDMAL